MYKIYPTADIDCGEIVLKDVIKSKVLRSKLIDNMNSIYYLSIYIHNDNNGYAIYLYDLPVLIQTLNHWLTYPDRIKHLNRFEKRIYCVLLTKLQRFNQHLYNYNKQIYKQIYQL